MALSLELTQKQTLSTRMLQTLGILQMSAQELESYIQNVSLENPVIELTPGDDASFSFNDIKPDNFDKRQDILRKLDWLEATDLQNKVYYDEDRDMGNIDIYSDERAAEETL